MPWVRGLLLGSWVPCVVGIFVPSFLDSGSSVKGEWWRSGWLLIAAGSIFFTGHLKFVLGGEPSRLVRGGLYRVSRNPMYVGVLLAVFGQAILFASLTI